MISRELLLEENQWTVTGESAPNTAFNVTKSGVAGKCHYIYSFEAVAVGAAPANDIAIQVKDGATVIWQSYIGSGTARGERTGVAFQAPLKIAAGHDVVLAAAGGGAGCVVRLNLMGGTAS